MANLKQTSPRVLALSLRCSCSARFSALSWAVNEVTWVFCPCCGRFWAVPVLRFLSAGRPFAWAPGALPALPAPALPARQLSLFD